MKFLSIIFLVCSITIPICVPAQGNKASDENSPPRKKTKTNLFYALPILYYPTEKIYAFSDFDFVQKMISESQLSQSAASYVLQYCGDRPTGVFAVKNYKLTIEEIVEILPNVKSTTQYEVLCELPYEPRYQQSPDGYHFGIGYFVDKSTKYTSRHNLPTFPSLATSQQLGADHMLIHGRVSLKTRYTQLTVHRFYAYNQSLLPRKSCTEYKMSGDSIKQREIMENLYDHKNQNQLFTHLREPLRTKVADTLTSVIHPGEYFVPHNMIPIDDFVEDSLRMTTCVSYFTTTPIWKSISEVAIKKVEDFIQKVAQKLNIGTLKVRTEIKGVQEWMANDGSGRTEAALTYDSRTVPISKYFIKFLIYRPAFPFEEEKVQYKSQMSRYYIMIVIHNELSDFSPRLCNKSQRPICKQYGLDVTIDENEKGFVYCCTLDDPHLKIVQYKDYGEVLSNQTEEIDLNQDVREMDVDTPANGENQSDDNIFAVYDNYEIFDLHHVVTHRSTAENPIPREINVVDMLRENSQNAPST